MSLKIFSITIFLLIWQVLLIFSVCHYLLRHDLDVDSRDRLASTTYSGVMDSEYRGSLFVVERKVLAKRGSLDIVS